MWAGCCPVVNMSDPDQEVWFPTLAGQKKVLELEWGSWYVFLENTLLYLIYSHLYYVTPPSSSTQRDKYICFYSVSYPELQSDVGKLSRDPDKV